MAFSYGAPGAGMILSNNNIATGAEFSFVFKEIIDERNRHGLPINERITVAHEIGHQFGLGHGTEEPPNLIEIPEHANMGLMKAGVINDPLIIARYKNLVRSRLQSPGQ